MPDPSAANVPGDRALVLAARASDDAAFSELYFRHVQAVREGARSICRSASDANDATADAFTSVRAAMQLGHGPEVAVRPYLLHAARRSAEARRLPAGVAGAPLATSLAEIWSSLEVAPEHRGVATAFAALPEHWQVVLWHTEVDCEAPAQIAPLLGVAPAAVSTIVGRAHDGLREAYLVATAPQTTSLECAWVRPRLNAYERRSLPDREQQRVAYHVDGCERCSSTLIELGELAARLPTALVPAVLGIRSERYRPSVAAATIGVGLGAAAGATMARSRQLLVGASVAGAAMVAMALAAGALVINRPPPTEVAPSPSSSTTSSLPVDETGATPATVPGSDVPTTDAPDVIEPPVVDAEAPVVVAVAPSTTVVDDAVTGGAPTATVVAPRPANPSPGNPSPGTVAPGTTPGTTPSGTVPAVTTPSGGSTTPPATTVAAGPTTTRPTATTQPNSPTTTRPPAPTTTRPPAVTTVPPAPTTTRPPTTTLPPTTTVVGQPAQLSIAAVNAAPGYAGGQVPLDISVGNRVGQGGGGSAVLRVNQAAVDPTITLTVAPGVALAGDIPSGWVCSQAGRSIGCDLPDLAPGVTVRGTLTLAIPGTATASTAVSIVAQADNASQQSSSVTIPVYRVDHLVYQGWGRGQLISVGNTVLTCDESDPRCTAAQSGQGVAIDRTDLLLRHVNAAPQAAPQPSFNSSSASLDLGGAGVEKAVLVWSGDVRVGGGVAPDPNARDRVQLTLPNGSTSAVVANDLRIDRLGSVYVAYADVTALVRAGGSGLYVTGNVQTAPARNSFGGWSLMVITDDPSQPRRMFVVTDPFATFSAFASYSVDVAVPTDVDRPATRLVVTAFQGRLGASPEWLTLGDTQLGDQNPFGATVTGAVAPAYSNNFGVDVDVYNTALDVDSQTTRLEAQSLRDSVRLAIVGLSIDLVQR
jgi:DNA-directed RNA polymerase specialized sigma24 family protein